MTYKELETVIENNTEASWQEFEIKDALETYIDKVVEQLEQEQKNPNSCVYAWSAYEKAIEIVKGGAK